MKETFRRGFLSGSFFLFDLNFIFFLLRTIFLSARLKVRNM